MNKAQELMRHCEVARSFGFSGIALVLERTSQEAAELVDGALVRLLRDKGPEGELVQLAPSSTSSELVELVVIFNLDSLWSWLFHFTSGELFHQ